MITVTTDDLFPFPLSDQEILDNKQLEINQESLKYLIDTDWYITRFIESGTPIPLDITNKRLSARESIIHGV